MNVRPRRGRTRSRRGLRATIEFLRICAIVNSSLFVFPAFEGSQAEQDARRVAIARELLTAPNVPFTELVLMLPKTKAALSDEARDLLEHVGRPEALRSLGFYKRWTPVASLRWLWSAPLATGLERVVADDGVGSLPAWIAESVHLPTSVTSVELSFWHGWRGSVATVNWSSPDPVDGRATLPSARSSLS